MLDLQSVIILITPLSKRALVKCVFLKTHVDYRILEKTNVESKIVKIKFKLPVL